jgi:hypothetical protein
MVSLDAIIPAAWKGWVNPNLPRIRGPVWEVNRKLAEEKLKERGVT